jgi:hypothetical protein
MPRACTVCTHPERTAIDRALVESTPKRRVATRYGLVESAVRRHAAAHLPAKLALAAKAAEVTEADDLLGTARRVQREALEVLEAAKANGNLGGVLQAIDRIQKGAALLATLAEHSTVEETRVHLRMGESACLRVLRP